MNHIFAKAFLFYHLILHIFKSVGRLFSPRENQLNKFRHNFQTEDPLWFPTEQERESFSQFSKCINCGACELDCHMLNEHQNLRFKPNWVAVACTRYSPDLKLVGEIVDVCGKCPGCTVECPTNVPIKKMSEFVISKVEKWKIQNHE